MSDFSKTNKTKEVKFKKDFGTFYKAKETHYIHEDTVKSLKLEDYADVKDVNWKEEYKKAKESDAK